MFWYVTNSTFGALKWPSRNVRMQFSNWCIILQHHLSTVDSEEKLGLSTDSILYYTMDSSVKRIPGRLLFCYYWTGSEACQWNLYVGSSSIPHCSPYYALGQKMAISIILKGRHPGMFLTRDDYSNHDILTIGASQGSCAVLAYHVLINEKTLQVLLVAFWIFYSSAFIFTELR